MTEPNQINLTLLGSKHTDYPKHYDPDLLEVFNNPHLHHDYWVNFDCREFTTLCPITGQPDFATIVINYVPDLQMVESKSLKLYLFSYRNHHGFHEDGVNQIMLDLWQKMQPKYIEVLGLFMPRGGIAIRPFVNYARQEDRWRQLAQKRFVDFHLSSMS